MPECLTSVWQPGDLDNVALKWRLNDLPACVKIVDEVETSQAGVFGPSLELSKREGNDAGTHDAVSDTPAGLDTR